MSEKMISSDNLSKDLLKNIFDDAYLDAGFDEKDGDLYVKETWKTWFFLDEKKRYFSMSLYFIINEDSSMADRLEYASNVTREFILIKANVEKTVIAFKTYVWLEGGMTYKNIIKTYKAFLWVTEAALDDDKKNVLS